jgi:hypothetical protein
LEIRNINSNLYSKISKLKEGNQLCFFDELMLQICVLREKYILKKESENNICAANHKFLYLFYDIYDKLLDELIMDKNFLLNFLYQAILLYYDAIHTKNSNFKIINESIINLCKNNNTPIVNHCLNLIVNKYIFESNWTEHNYLLKFFKDDLILDIHEIRIKTAEIFLFNLYTWIIIKAQKII